MSIDLYCIPGDIYYRYNMYQSILFDDWVMMNWFTLVLMLFTSFMVAVPVSHLRAYSRKGNKLLLQWVVHCDFPSKGGLVFIKLIADIMVDLQELYMSSMLESSICNVNISWVGADGCWLRKCSSWCVLTSCLLKKFQCHFRCPKETCAAINPWMACWICLQNWLE